MSKTDVPPKGAGRPFRGDIRLCGGHPGLAEDIQFVVQFSEAAGGRNRRKRKKRRPGSCRMPVSPKTGFG